MHAVFPYFQNNKGSYGVDHVVEYSYDSVGNRLTMTKDGKTTKYTYNQLNRLQTASTTDETGKDTSHITYEYEIILVIQWNINFLRL